MASRSYGVKQPLVQVLVREDIEMVEPEIGQLLLRVAARCRSPAATLACCISFSTSCGNVLGAGRTPCGGCASASMRLRYSSTLMPVALGARPRGCGYSSSSALRAQAQRGEPLQPRLQPGIVETLGMKLLVDPFFEAHLLDAFDVARTRPIAQAVRARAPLLRLRSVR